MGASRGEGATSPQVRVVLLGWHDATERHLRSIANVHAAHGREVLPFLSDAAGSLSRKNGFLEHGNRLAEELAQAHAALPLPIVFHSFSNAGLWSLAGLLDALKTHHPALLDAHIATVLDSAPGFPEHFDWRFTARTAPLAFVPGLLHRMKRPVAHRHPVLSPTLAVLFGLWHVLAPQQIRFMARAPRRIRDAHRGTTKPLLIVYGGQDELVLPEDVEHFAIRAEQEGLRVERLYFPTSRHVRHIVQHRREYDARLTAFLAAID